MQSNDIVVTLGEKRRVDAQVRGHRIVTDQPIDNGGDDAAPSPFELFLASLGACAGLFVQAFCARRGLDTSKVRLVTRPTYGPDKLLSGVAIDVEVPPDFPAKYREAVAAAAAQCTVKKVIAAQPAIAVAVVDVPRAVVPHVDEPGAQPCLS